MAGSARRGRGCAAGQRSRHPGAPGAAGCRPGHRPPCARNGPRPAGPRRPTHATSRRVHASPRRAGGRPCLRSSPRSAGTRVRRGCPSGQYSNLCSTCQDSRASDHRSAAAAALRAPVLRGGPPREIAPARRMPASSGSDLRERTQPLIRVVHDDRSGELVPQLLLIFVPQQPAIVSRTSALRPYDERPDKPPDPRRADHEKQVDAAGIFPDRAAIIRRGNQRFKVSNESSRCRLIT
jgi:hypothetical protein